MKAESLRIGNYVDVYKGDVHYGIEVVNNISSMGINERLPGEYYAVFENPMNDELLVKPIPLTEEWLIRFGFEGSHALGFRILINQRYNLEISDLNNVKFQRRGLEINCMMNLEYVHQLQNLYYPLNGEELTWRV